jgi:succinoglycan biosynthesis transport protein ExoP
MKHMLEFSKWPSAPARESEQTYDIPSAAELSLAASLATVVGFIRRRFFVIISILPLTVALAVAYLYTTPPVYSAQARIMIDTGKLQVFKKSNPGDEPGNAAMVDTKLEILKSDNFALSIINNLHLTHDPDFVESGTSLIDRAMDLLHHPSGLSHSLNRLFKNEPESGPDLRGHILQVFKNRLTAARLGTSYVIEIQFQSNDPDRAAQIANAVADAFIVDQSENNNKIIAKATTWLQDRLNELRAQALAAERAVVEYKTKNNIVDTGGRLMNDQQLAELNANLAKARADAVEARARVDRVSEILSNGDLDPAATQIATVADALRSDVISKLRKEYLDHAQREALLSNRLGPDHLATVDLRNRMREIRRSIFDEFRRIGEAYKSDYDIAKARENSLQESLTAIVAKSQTTNKAQIELHQLESSAQSYRATYDNFQHEYIDSVQQQSFPTEASVITRAERPAHRSSPQPFKIFAIATVAGLAFGLGLSLLREIVDRVFRSSSQVESRLKTQCVAMVPMIKPNVKVATNEAYPAEARIIAADSGLRRYVINSPLSRFAESIRAIKVTADICGHKVIGITSSLPNEGKSTISTCLAQLCAHGGARVILIDGDLRNPVLSRELAPKATVGLIDTLTGATSLDQVTWTDQSTQLSFLPVVTASRLMHTSQVLASPAMKRLFARVRESYDYVVVDLSPLAPVVDARSATPILDCFFLVIEWGKTKIDTVEHALNTAHSVYDNLLGVVLNKVDFNRLRHYESSTDQYYRNSYYSNYGYND